MQTGFFLTTERIRFRCWTPDDLPLAINLWTNRSVTQLIADLGEPSEEKARDRLAREVSNLQSYGVQYWPIFLHDGDHLGCCGLRPYQYRIFEIGAHLFPERWGQGYACEALQSMVAHAFETLKVGGLFARHNPKNHGSKRLMEKLGFRYWRDDFMAQTGLNHPAYLLENGKIQ